MHPARCLQAFQALVGGHKLSNAEELELVRSLEIPQQQVRALRPPPPPPAELPAHGALHGCGLPQQARLASGSPCQGDCPAGTEAVGGLERPRRLLRRACPRPAGSKLHVPIHA